MQHLLSLLMRFAPLLLVLLRPKHTSTTRSALLRRRLSLHLLRHLNIHLKELGHAAVEADGLALVEVGFAVLGRDALLGAGVY